MSKPVLEMTDLEFVNHWIDNCSDFINPILFRELNGRGLGRYVNLLSGNIEERKAQAYARLSQSGKVFGDPEIDNIAGAISKIKDLQAAISKLDPTDTAKLLDLAKLLQHHSEYVKDYFKQNS